jgi:hypothetical protein
LGFAQISRSRRISLTYSFRYFQDYEEPVQLPDGFEPTRIGIEIHSGRDSAHAFRQAFVWKAQGMSLETEPPGMGAPGGPDVDSAVRDAQRKGGVDPGAETY